MLPRSLAEAISALRESSSPQNDAWTNRVMAYERVGRTGTMSCTPVGAGGWTGCSGKLIEQAYAEKRSDPSVHFGELIAAERAKRLSTVDAEAAETQSMVEQAEKDMEARQKAQQGKDQSPADGKAPVPPK